MGKDAEGFTSQAKSAFLELVPLPDTPDTVVSLCKTVRSLFEHAGDEFAFLARPSWADPLPPRVSAQDLLGWRQQLLRFAISGQPKSTAIVALKSLPSRSAWATNSSVEPEPVSVSLILVLADAVDTLARLLGEGVIETSSAGADRGPCS